LVATIRPILAGDASSFIIHDNSSEIAKFIPQKYVKPLVIVARILGFDGIDDYIIQLIKDRLEMFDDISHDNLNDAFQKYIHNMIIKGKDVVPNTWKRTLYSSTITTEVKNKKMIMMRRKKEKRFNMNLLVNQNPPTDIIFGCSNFRRDTGLLLLKRRNDDKSELHLHNDYINQAIPMIVDIKDLASVFNALEEYLQREQR
jgi:hypothetical protein